MHLHSLSTHGASGRLAQPCSVGQRVRMRFACGLDIAGTVRRADSAGVGIAFDRSMPSMIVEGEDLHRASSQRRRSPRFAFRRLTSLRLEGHDFPATIRNISRGGVLVDTDAVLARGQKVTIESGRLPPLEGEVRWYAHGRAGIMFPVLVTLH